MNIQALFRAAAHNLEQLAARLETQAKAQRTQDDRQELNAHAQAVRSQALALRAVDGMYGEALQVSVDLGERGAAHNLEVTTPVSSGESAVVFSQEIRPDVIAVQ